MLPIFIYEGHKNTRSLRIWKTEKEFIENWKIQPKKKLVNQVRANQNQRVINCTYRKR